MLQKLLKGAAGRPRKARTFGTGAAGRKQARKKVGFTRTRYHALFPT